MAGNGATAGLSQHDIRQDNLARCAVALRDHGASSAVQVARIVGCSRPTAATLLDELVARGLAKSRTERTLSRHKHTVYEFAGATRHVLAVQIAPAAVVMLLGNLAGEIVAWRIASSPPSTPHAIASTVDAFLSGQGLSHQDVAAVAIGVSGILDVSGQVTQSTFLPQLEGMMPTDVLRGIPAERVTWGNDVDLAALGEATYGAAKGKRDVLYVRFGTNFNTGLLLDGEIRQGHHGVAGEYGNLFGKGTRIEAQGVGYAPVLIALSHLVDPDILVISADAKERPSTFISELVREAERYWPTVSMPKIIAGRLGDAATVVGALERGYRLANAIELGSDTIATPRLLGMHATLESLRRQFAELERLRQKTATKLTLQLVDVPDESPVRSWAKAHRGVLHTVEGHGLDHRIKPHEAVVLGTLNSSSVGQVAALVRDRAPIFVCENMELDVPAVQSLLEAARDCQCTLQLPLSQNPTSASTELVRIVTSRNLGGLSHIVVERAGAQAITVEQLVEDLIDCQFLSNAPINAVSAVGILDGLQLRIPTAISLRFDNEMTATLRYVAAETDLPQRTLLVHAARGRAEAAERRGNLNIRLYGVAESSEHESTGHSLSTRYERLGVASELEQRLNRFVEMIRFGPDDAARTIAIDETFKAVSALQQSLLHAGQWSPVKLSDDGSTNIPR